MAIRTRNPEKLRQLIEKIATNCEWYAAAAQQAETQTRRRTLQSLAAAASHAAFNASRQLSRVTP